MTFPLGELQIFLIQCRTRPHLGEWALPSRLVMESDGRYPAGCLGRGDGRGGGQDGTWGYSLRWSRFFGQVVKVDSRTEQEAPRWPERDDGSRRSSRRG